MIRQKVLIPNSTPEAVYKAFLSSEGHSEFTGSPAKITARVGSKFRAWHDYISGKNIALAKGKMIEHEWVTNEFPEGYGPSILKITLRKKEDGTELYMVQTRVPASQVKRYKEGWHSAYWDPMKAYFQKMKNDQATDGADSFPAMISLYLW